MADVIPKDQSKGDASVQSPLRPAIAGISAAVLLLAINLWLHPKIARLDSAQVGALGLALSAWGVFLGAVGFGITWWQIQRSRTAAQAVANTVRWMRHDYASFDVITELRTARAHAETVITALATSNWSDANKALWGIRVSLMKMASSKDVLQENEIGACKDFVADILAASDLIQQNAQQTPEAIPASQLVSEMTEADNFLITLEQQLKGSFRGNR